MPGCAPTDPGLVEADLCAVAAAGHGAPAAVAGGGAVHEAQGAFVRAADAYPPDLGGQEEVDGVLGDQRQRGSGIGGDAGGDGVLQAAVSDGDLQGGRGAFAAAWLSMVTSLDVGSRPSATASTARSTVSRSRRQDGGSAGALGARCEQAGLLKPERQVARIPESLLRRGPPPVADGVGEVQADPPAVPDRHVVRCHSAGNRLNRTAYVVRARPHPGAHPLCTAPAAPSSLKPKP